MLIPLSDQDNILFLAFRYALGRQTYVVGFVIDLVRKGIPELLPQTRTQMLKEIRAAGSPAAGGLGDPKIDAPGWIALAKELEKSLASASPGEEPAAPAPAPAVELLAADAPETEGQVSR